jgi:4-amino-4-deoxy-L-arabinose transferase-like glycosyltransferase
VILQEFMDLRAARGRHAGSPVPIADERPWLATLGRWSGAGGVLAAAWLIRAIGITTSYDVFIDEVTYSNIARSLASGGGLVLYGKPFDLHPPAAFALYALAIKVFSLHGPVASVLFGLRPFVALLGAMTCAVVFLLVSGVARWQVGMVAAVVVALDPFQIFYDSHVMLEAPAQLASAVTVLLLALSLRGRSERESWTLVILAGLAAGTALCAKEYFGLVMALALLICLITGWVLERAKAAAALGLMLGSFVLSEALTIVTSGFHQWWVQVGSGLLRLVGSQQTTGFNSSAVHVSFLSRAAADAPHYGVTYLILGAGSIAGFLQLVGVWRRRSQWRHMAEGKDRGRLLVAIWAVAAAAYVFYATALGTLEEQVYYLLLAPALCTLVLGAAHALPRWSPHWRKLAVALTGVVLVADSAVWVAVHRTPDAEYRQLLSWESEHVRTGSTVAVTDTIAQFLLPDVVLGDWATIPALKAHHVDYVLVNTSLTSQGYGLATPEFQRYLQAHATVVFRATGPTDGALVVYDVQSITGAGR